MISRNEVVSRTEKTITRLRKRFAIVGTGARACSFLDTMVQNHPDTAELVGVCDLSTVRMKWHVERQRRLHNHGPVPAYVSRDFDRMVHETRPDTVIVTTIDSTHDYYVVRAMELGCDVICEKPMATDATKVLGILDAIERTGQKLQITFNLRYLPHATKVHQLIREGAIGQPTAVCFSYFLNTQHGGDYFRRWHREKDKSGGLLVHKSAHHFDLANWWVGSSPETVFAMGSLRFYGRQNAVERGQGHLTDYDRYTGTAQAASDPFALDLKGDSDLTGLYLGAEDESQYIRDRNVFGDRITSEDTMSVMARYRNGVNLSYSLVCYSPREHWRATITGTGGQIEITGEYGHHVINGNGAHAADPIAAQPHRVTLTPMFGKTREISVEEVEGGHGGADTLMMRDLFGGPELKYDPSDRAASHIDGAAAVLLGICANRSIATGAPVLCDTVLNLRTAPRTAR